MRAGAAAAHIQLAFLPFQVPELMPCEDLWRLSKAVIAANRADEAVQEQAERAVAWLTNLVSSAQIFSGYLLGSKVTTKLTTERLDVLGHRWTMRRE
jgi:hypothetical protein